jgi:tRNA uridine 5-carboxymethylaminomethyl modification enzyme
MTFGANGDSITVSQQTTALALLRRPEMTAAALRSALPELADVPRHALEQVEIETKYAGYITRQSQQVDRHRRLEERAIPEDFDFAGIRSLSHEGREKLARLRPRSLGQAARIPGVTPADISILMVWLENSRRRHADCSLITVPQPVAETAAAES